MISLTAWVKMANYLLMWSASSKMRVAFEDNDDDDDDDEDDDDDDDAQH